jgi:hypothetical protein
MFALLGMATSLSLFDGSASFRIFLRVSLINTFLATKDLIAITPNKPFRFSVGNELFTRQECAVCPMSWRERGALITDKFAPNWKAHISLPQAQKIANAVTTTSAINHGGHALSCGVSRSRFAGDVPGAMS